MRTATAAIQASTPSRPQPVTLLELVQAVGETTADDREVVAAVLYMLRSGRVRLTGNFRGAPCDALA